MSEETNVDINDLDAFETEFFQTPKDVVEVEVEGNQEVEEIEDDHLAPEDDEDASAETGDEDEDEEDEPEEKPEPRRRNRKSAKERIEELVAQTREQERRERELVRRLEALEAPKAEERIVPQTTAFSPEGPDPDAVGADGEPVYALGEFDPKFIRDLTKFTIAQESKAAKEAQAQEARMTQAELERQQVQDHYLKNLEEVEKELPDVREAVGELAETFMDIEPMYGEYLATTIMASDYGPQIMYYLSQNIGEAQSIVASGPAAATKMIGRLEAKFLPSNNRKSNKRVSDAPPPPSGGSRGSSGRTVIRPDTDDLDAFERVFYKK